jgi:hypothetical protein
MQGIIEYKEFIPDINALIIEFAEKGNLNDYLKELKEPLGKILCVEDQFHRMGY